MKKVNDWFFAGMVAGAIGGAGIILINIVLLLLGVKHGTYWQAMGGLFYNKQLLQTWHAQVHGAIDALGVSAMNGVLLSLTLLLTGKDYLYAKSVALSAAGAYFLFLFVYPQTGLEKNSAIVPWIALFGHTVSNGLFTGYLLDKMYSFKRIGEAENEQKSKRTLGKIYYVKESKNSRARFIKPKKV
ncbi:MAG: hypothetical protein NUK65_07410 [Firmicutes bacterium]|nr:hypothetical protein [Bacillota bacterium]